MGLCLPFYIWLGSCHPSQETLFDFKTTPSLVRQEVEINSVIFMQQVMFECLLSDWTRLQISFIFWSQIWSVLTFKLCNFPSWLPRSWILWQKNQAQHDFRWREEFGHGFATHDLQGVGYFRWNHQCILNVYYPPLLLQCCCKLGWLCGQNQ